MVTWYQNLPDESSVDKFSTRLEILQGVAMNLVYGGTTSISSQAFFEQQSAAVLHRDLAAVISKHPAAAVETRADRVVGSKQLRDAVESMLDEATVDALGHGGPPALRAPPKAGKAGFTGRFSVELWHGTVLRTVQPSRCGTKKAPQLRCRAATCKTGTASSCVECGMVLCFSCATNHATHCEEMQREFIQASYLTMLHSPGQKQAQSSVNIHLYCTSCPQLHVNSSRMQYSGRVDFIQNPLARHKKPTILDQEATKLALCVACTYIHSSGNTARTIVVSSSGSWLRLPISNCPARDVQAPNLCYLFDAFHTFPASSVRALPHTAAHLIAFYKISPSQRRWMGVGLEARQLGICLLRNMRVTHPLHLAHILRVFDLQAAFQYSYTLKPR